jgi:hypothetical protein
MPNGDQGLAQAIYLANMFAQRGTCQCTACQLLRQSTDGMIKQVLGKPTAVPVQGDLAALAQSLGSIGGLGGEG